MRPVECLFVCAGLSKLRRPRVGLDRCTILIVTEGVLSSETGYQRAALRLMPRVGYLALLFVVELVVLSIWLDGASLAGSHGLAEMVSRWGAWTVRLTVAIALGSLIFGESRARAELAQISDELAQYPIAWRLLAAHFATMLVFGGFSWILFGSHAAGLTANVVTAAWFVTGVIGIGSAAAAFVPVPFWARIFRSTGDAWIYVLVAGLVACFLGLFAWRFWTPLARVTFRVVEVLLRPFVEVVANPAKLVLGTPAFEVEIAPECSGYEGVGLVLAFGTAWLWFLRREWRFPQALLLLPVGVLTIWVLNAVRIAALILIGNAGAVRVALGGFHSQAGWIAFNLVALGLCVGARRIPWLTTAPSGGFGESAHALPREGVDPTAAYLLPFLAILTAAMISRSLTGDFEWFYPLRVVAAVAILWMFRSVYLKLDWRFGWMAVGAGVVVFVLWLALDRVMGVATADKAGLSAFLQASRPAQIGWYVFRIVGGVVTVPIAEELAFRGFLQRRLQSADFESIGWRTFSWLPFLISSIAFGLMHGERWLAGTAAGMLYSIVMIRRGRFGEARARSATPSPTRCSRSGCWPPVNGKSGRSDRP